ncbi:hypothetical protein [Streptomyces sp. ICBB 8177]|uniref:hypothetical protein n=1 Tax=Streptomyces sp. ICBB 8177 TaxID=563922 RepID=UPI000D671FD8|nr:hypothetical protein [Streptomyces sp. ICBB 8177]PWI44978.1 hypothetical protein CK485_07290 [Streptomyces sp. ICBB 8177]
MRRVTAVRTGALLLGVAALAWAVLWSIGPYQDTVPFHYARLCPGGIPTPAGDADGCVAQETGTLTGRHSYVESIDDGSGGVSNVTHYVLAFRRASGTVQSREVSASLYDSARPGENVELRTWRGGVVRLDVGDWYERYDPSQEWVLGYTALAGWTGLGLILWVWFGDGTFRQLFGPVGLRAFGWVHSGFWTLAFAHYFLTGRRGTTDCLVATGVWLFIIAIGVFCVRWGWDDCPGSASLALTTRARRGKGPRER